MIDVLRSEWIKFRSVRSTVVLVLAAGALVVLVGFFAARNANHVDAGRSCTSAATPSATAAIGDGSATPSTVDPCQNHLGDITVGVPFALFLFGALGVQIIGQEYRFNTIRPTFTAVPDRVRVLVAKLVVVSAACAAISVAMLVVCAGLGAAMVHHFAIDGTDGRVIWGTILFNVGWTAMGMGVGAILRQPIAAMLVLLIDAFVVENLLQSLVHGAGHWIPFLNGIQMTVRDPDRHSHLRAPLAGGIYFFVVAAAVWGIGAYLADKRDA